MSASKRGTRLLGPENKIEHKDIVEFSSLNSSSDSKVDDLSVIENVLNGSSSVIDGDKPILLFPLRLETKYVTEGGTDKLKIRFFPDDIVIRKHEEALIQYEYDDGITFWETVYENSGALNFSKVAWTVLAKKHGNERAAWIRKVTQPLNWPLNNEENDSNSGKLTDFLDSINDAVTGGGGFVSVIKALQGIQNLCA